MKKKVYLAGPITGTSYGEATDWRAKAVRDLEKWGIAGFSPMRGKAYLSKEEELLDAYNDQTMSSITAINIRDYNDTRTSDAILVNLLDAKRVSIGTVMEIAWAKAHKIPIVLIMEKEGNVHDHGMLTYNCIRVTTLHEGIACIKQLLLPY
jgi:nucleoside 2-deoxyribosyltransferase